jgi:hypothetical protein
VPPRVVAHVHLLLRDRVRDRCCWLGIFPLTIRQMGHAVWEPPCHDMEELLLGFNTRAKCVVFSTYLLLGLGLGCSGLTFEPS